ncbi:MAG: AarF/ABC1/UbiB kinase family protein [Desulfobacteraceae bacterium]|jgi:predicted unusual protein kinase regulating ubiquinone biosynthesis (AarF/ABC1/UbiB family)
MTDNLPTGKVGRALSGGRTAAKVGGHVLGYYAKRPFLSQDARRVAKQRAAQNGAHTLFQGLSLLRGTALKMAQQLSLEMDMLPEAACRELAKAYHQVPPVNRALVRKVVQDALGRSPETAFRRFDLDAFAGASLGQVHYAENSQGEPLAVKIQYPGIAKTIDSDISLLRQLLRPMMQSDQLMPGLKEVADRLREEVDYCQEAENAEYFADRLKVEGVKVPKVDAQLSAATVLSTALMPGKPLDQWLLDRPGQAARDRIAQKLHDIVIKGIYELNVIHADPNPGNFIIADDETIGLVDFGCIKRLGSRFVAQYGQLVRAAAHYQNGQHFARVVEMGVVSPDLTGPALEEIRNITDAAGRWFGRLFAADYFDFGVQSGFMADGKAVMRRYHHLRRHLNFDPEFIFLDRTRYGLWRIFELMGARVCFRNPYEY